MHWFSVTQLYPRHIIGQSDPEVFLKTLVVSSVIRITISDHFVTTAKFNIFEL